MNIKYPRDSKILHPKNTKKTVKTDAENYKKTTEMQLNIDELQTKVNGLNQAVDVVSQSTQNFDDALNQISTNSLGIATLNQNLAALQSEVTVNTSNVAANTQSIINLQSAKQNNLIFDNAPTQNSNNVLSSGKLYDALQAKQDVLTAGNNITIDNNNIISATGGASYTAGANVYINSNNVISATDTTYTAGTGIDITNGVISATNSGGLSSVTAGDVDSESATSGQVLTADGQGGASWQNASGGGLTQEQESKLNDAYNYYISHIVEPDPNYSPQTFSDYPAGTILQGYAKFERKYDLSSYSSYSMPKMIFSAENNSTGTIHLQINMSVSVACQALVNVYLNGTSIFNEIATFSNASTPFVYEKTLQGVTLSDANTIYVRFDPNPTATYIYLTKQKCELIAPNAEVINELSPYYVEYADGVYYISDCSSGTARYAEINVEDIININSVSWIETGLPACQYKTLFSTTQYGTTFLLNEKFSLRNFNNITYGTNLTRNTSKSYARSLSTDWCQVTLNTYCYGIYTDNSKCCLFSVSSPMSMGYSDFKSNTYANICSAKYFNFLEKSFSNRFIVGTMPNGNCYIDLASDSNVTPVLITKGTNCHCYLEIINNQTFINVFLKHYDKILKYRYKYTNTFQLISIEEIGAYEEYFEGANNDYFVVRNGLLEYHKKPINI